MSRHHHQHHAVHLFHPASSKGPFLKRHSLSLATGALLILLITLYSLNDPQTRIGSFFGNAIADWSGVFVTVVATKWLFEQGSAESRQNPDQTPCSPPRRFVREHSLTIFLLITGAAWVIAFSRMDPNARWGSVVGNIVSEWTQQVGLVLMTKKLMEEGSKESEAAEAQK